MSDRSVRELERQVASGDKDAASLLARARHRAEPYAGHMTLDAARRSAPAWLPAVEDAYQNATETWTGCDWHHEVTCPRCGGMSWLASGIDPGEPDIFYTHDFEIDPRATCPNCRGVGSIPCPGGVDDCDYCEQAKKSAECAELDGARAMALVGKWDLDDALIAAQEAAGHEYTHGANPTWGPLQFAIGDAIEVRDEAEDEAD